jgi:hypothetical protein
MLRAVWVLDETVILATAHCLLIPRRSGAAIADVLFHDLLQPTLAFQDEFDRIPQGTVSAATFRDVMGVFFHFIACVSDGDSKPAIPHHWQVNDIVADKACFRRSEFFLRQNFAKRPQLVLNALADVVELEITCADRYGL